MQLYTEEHQGLLENTRKHEKRLGNSPPESPDRTFRDFGLGFLIATTRRQQIPTDLSQIVVNSFSLSVLSQEGGYIKKSISKETIKDL